LIPIRLTLVQWLICLVAVIGFAFDTYELMMLPLVLPPALEELGGIYLGSSQYGLWRDLMFYVPAVAGGVFGLLGGYLTDRFGRRRVLTWSIFLYAASALCAGFASSLGMLLLFRTLTFVGVCVEFAAAVAWLAELFPDPKLREVVLGYTQAFSSLGGFMVSGAYILAEKLGPLLPAIYTGHAAWRYTLISGVIPALPLIAIRPFLPESPLWLAKKGQGTLRRPNLSELFKPELRTATLITALMFACSLGVAIGAIQQLPQIVPGLPELKALSGSQKRQIAGTVQMIQEIGGLVGRAALAFFAVIIVKRRRLLRMFQIPGLVLVPLLFIFPATRDLTLLSWGVFFVGFFVIGQLSFWGNYLPRIYPTHLRGTGESFAASIGGRAIGTAAALLTTQLARWMPAGTAAARLAYGAGAVAFLVYAAALIMSFWLPEPDRDALPE
jgi:hypothetical protein